MKKRILAVLTAPAIIALSTLPAASQAEHVRSVQRALAAEGFEPGTIDGIVGPLTRVAVRKFHDRYGMKATGRANAKRREAATPEVPRLPPFQ